jgi:hypothetical protein
MFHFEEHSPILIFSGSGHKLELVDAVKMQKCCHMIRILFSHDVVVVRIVMSRVHVVGHLEC